MICPKCGQDCSEKYCGNCGEQLYSGIDMENKAFRGSETELRDVPFFKEGEAPGVQSLRRRPKEQRAERGTSRKRESVKKESVKKESGSRASSDKHIKKEIKEKDSRIRRLETEMKELSGKDKNSGREEKRSRRKKEFEDSAGQELKEAAVKGAAGMTVLFSRILQLISFALMAYMVWLMQGQFLRDGDSLGSIYTMLEEHNYALALYVAAAGGVLFFGVLWSLWILSKKDAGGSLRLKKYDTGRGFVPFLLCGIICIFLPAALSVLPQPEEIAVSLASPISAATLKGLTRGGICALSALNTHRETLLFCSFSGALLSFIRKLLRV